jgi:hypothetical protein
MPPAGLSNDDAGIQPPRGWDAAGFMVAEVAFLLAVHLLGGVAWVGLGLLAVLGQIVTSLRVAAIAVLLPAVAWAVAHRLTGNRELFFPYAMALATEAAGRCAGRLPGRPRLAAALGGALMVAAFLGVRLAQAAGGQVLAVEAAVAAVILAGVAAVSPLTGTLWTKIATAAVASLAAYAGLAL